MNTKDAAKIQEFLQSGMNCGIYKEFLVFLDNGNYWIYDGGFKKLTERQKKQIEFWKE